MSTSRQIGQETSEVVLAEVGTGDFRAANCRRLRGNSRVRYGWRVQDLRELGEPRDRRALEELERGEHQPHVAGAVDDTNGQQRIAAQREEVVMAAHPADPSAEHFDPDRRQTLLSPGAWRLIVRPQLGG